MVCFSFLFLTKDGHGCTRIERGGWGDGACGRKPGLMQQNMHERMVVLAPALMMEAMELMVPPGIDFIALVFAMAGTGAFGLAYDLVLSVDHLPLAAKRRQRS